MLKSIEGNFDHPEVNQLLKNHFIELRGASPEGSAHVLDIPGLKVPSIKFWSLWEEDQLMGCGALKFFAPARKLFDNFGFKPCPPFAHYKEDVNSLYLTKLLESN